MCWILTQSWVEFWIQKYIIFIDFKEWLMAYGIKLEHWEKQTSLQNISKSCSVIMNEW